MVGIRQMQEKVQVDFRERLPVFRVDL